MQATQYQRPGWLTRKVINPSMRGLMRLGVSMRGSRVLEVRGRKSGEPRRTPVNLLDFQGRQYLVAPRGQCQWVRNVRADEGRLALLLGGKRDDRIGRELSNDEKPPVLRAYLERWKTEVGAFFAGVGPDASDAELLMIASDHPVFELSSGSSGGARAK